MSPRMDLRTGAYFEDKAKRQYVRLNLANLYGNTLMFKGNMD